MKWGVRRTPTQLGHKLSLFKKKRKNDNQNSSTDVVKKYGKTTLREMEDHLFQQEVTAKLDVDAVTKSGYTINADKYGCRLTKTNKDGLKTAIDLFEYNDSDHRYHMPDNSNELYQKADKYLKKDFSKLYEKGVNYTYEAVGEYGESVSLQEYKKRVTPYSISVNPKYDSAEIFFDEDGIFGYHSLSVEVGMKDDKIYGMGPMDG